MNFCVPPVEYKVTFCACNALIIGSKPDLSNTETNAEAIFFVELVLIFEIKRQN